MYEEIEETTENTDQKKTTEKKVTEASKTEQNKNYESGSYIVKVGKGYTLNVRSSPSTNSETIDKITDGEIIEIERVSGDWGYTSYYTSCGWVNMKYLEKADDKNTEYTNSKDQKSDESYSDGELIIEGEYSYDDGPCSGFPEMFAGRLYDKPFHVYPSLCTSTVIKDAIVYKDVLSEQVLGHISKGTEVNLYGIYCEYHNFYVISYKDKTTGKDLYGYIDYQSLDLD